MITFDKAFAIGNGAPLKSDLAVMDNGREIGRIYFMPLSFNNVHPYNVTMNGADHGFFSSVDDAKSYCENRIPEPKRYY